MGKNNTSKIQYKTNDIKEKKVERLKDSTTNNDTTVKSDEIESKHNVSEPESTVKPGINEENVLDKDSKNDSNKNEDVKHSSETILDKTDTLSKQSNDTMKTETKSRQKDIEVNKTEKKPKTIYLNMRPSQYKIRIEKDGVYFKEPYANFPEIFVGIDDRAAFSNGDSFIIRNKYFSK